MTEQDKVFSEKDMIAVGRQTTYCYRILPIDDTDTDTTMLISEFINLEVKDQPIYNVYINGHHVKCDLIRNEVPARYLIILNMIDHYIDTHIKNTGEL